MPNYTASEQNLTDVFHALADPTRRAVLIQLRNGPAAVAKLFEAFDMALPSFTQHLQVLEDCELISSEKKGRVRICRLEPSTMVETEQWMAEQRRYWEARLEKLALYLESPDQDST